MELLTHWWHWALQVVAITWMAGRVAEHYVSSTWKTFALVVLCIVIMFMPLALAMHGLLDPGGLTLTVGAR